MGAKEAQTGGFGCVSPSHPGWKPTGPSRASSVPAWNRKTGSHPTPCFWLPALDSSRVCSPLLSPVPDLLWDLSDLGLFLFHALLGSSGVWDVATFRKLLGVFMGIEMYFSWYSCTRPFHYSASSPPTWKQTFWKQRGRIIKKNCNLPQVMTWLKHHHFVWRVTGRFYEKALKLLTREKLWYFTFCCC